MKHILVIFGVLILGCDVPSNVAVHSIDLYDSTSVYDELPTWTDKALPDYPEFAIENRFEGKVLVRAMIDSSGTVTDARLYQSSAIRELDSAAVVTTWKSSFNPALKDGTPVPSQIIFQVDFSLAD